MQSTIHLLICITVFSVFLVSSCTGVEEITRDKEERCALEVLDGFETDRLKCESQFETGLDACAGDADCEYDVFMGKDACDWVVKENLFQAAKKCTDDMP